MFLFYKLNNEIKKCNIIIIKNVLFYEITFIIIMLIQIYTHSLLFCLFFPMLMIFYTIYSIEKIYTEKPCFDIKYNTLYNQEAKITFFKINQV